MTSKHTNIFITIIAIILVAVLGFLCLSFAHQYQLSVRRNMVADQKIHFAGLIQHHAMGSADVDLIEPWMTFEYLSISFTVPETYLESSLSISTSTQVFSNITLGRYARTVGTTTDSFVMTVRNAVKSYLVSEGK